MGMASLQAETEPQDGNPRTIYFSTGDNQDLLGLPLDSQATIEAAFEAIRKSYRVNRVWWRGGQDEVWGNQFVIREENRIYWRLWLWFKHLAYEKVGTNRIAVKAAHDRGMEIWMAYGLFDNGSGPDVGFSGFPYAAEDTIRIQHPEWISVNRFGTWRQGGPIEFCYPGARKAMVDYLTNYTVEGGYDGLAFLTYAENYSQRYEDEFGYNPSIVEAFKKRHGVDIRTQPFDKEAWAKLRGEYLTQFLREIHSSLATKGKKIAVCVDGKNPHTPTIWNVAGGIQTVGRVHMDVETWTKEGIVDEVNLWANCTEDTIQQGLAICQGTPSRLSVFRTRGPLPPRTPRLMFTGPDVESGFDWEHYIDFRDEKIVLQPEDSLTSDDAFSRRRVLTAICKGKHSAPLVRVVAATKDPDVFVRHMGVLALGTMKDAAAVPALEAAFLDPENSVRCRAATTLADFPGPKCVEKLFEAVARPSSTFQFNFRAVPEALKKLKNAGNLTTEELEFIASKTGHGDLTVRETALYCLKLIGAPATHTVEAALSRVVKNDPSPFARELALINLRSSFGPKPTVLSVIGEAMKDPDATTQMRAAVALAILARSLQPKEAKDKALNEVIAFFRQYGNGCKRTDADWGWRELGNAILDLGEEGRSLLERLIHEKQDRRLAELAWRVLYLRQGDQYYPTTEEQDREGHRRHPFPVEFGLP